MLVGGFCSLWTEPTLELQANNSTNHWFTNSFKLHMWFLALTPLSPHTVLYVFVHVCVDCCVLSIGSYCINVFGCILVCRVLHIYCARVQELELNQWSFILPFLCGKSGQSVTLPTPLLHASQPMSHPFTLLPPRCDKWPHQVLIQLALALIMLVMTDYQRGHCLRRRLDEWDRD